jgi:hypothetical protein
VTEKTESHVHLSAPGGQQMQALGAVGTVVRERPILFSAPMVRAILAGTKTQTRRAVKGLPLEWLGEFTPEFVADPGNSLCPYGNPGERLWVREAHYCIGETREVFYRASDGFSELQPPLQWSGPWKPSIHMPRWASRILLEVTEVRVERLQDISEADAVAEGCKADEEQVWWQGYAEDDVVGLHHQQVQDDAPPDWMIEPHRMKRTTWLERPAKKHYELLWGRINGFDGPGSWDANPWVWAVSFRRIEPASSNPLGAAK